MGSKWKQFQLNLQSLNVIWSLKMVYHFLRTIFSDFVPVWAAISFLRSPIVSSPLHLTRIFFPNRSLHVISIIFSCEGRNHERTKSNQQHFYETSWNQAETENTRPEPDSETKFYTPRTVEFNLLKNWKGKVGKMKKLNNDIFIHECQKRNSWSGRIVTTRAPPMHLPVTKNEFSRTPRRKIFTFIGLEIFSKKLWLRPDILIYYELAEFRGQSVNWIPFYEIISNYNNILKLKLVSYTIRSCPITWFGSYPNSFSTNNVTNAWYNKKRIY